MVLRDFRLSCNNAEVIRSIEEGPWALMDILFRKLELDQVSLDLLSLSMKNLARSCICADLGRQVWFVSPSDVVCTSYEGQ